MLKQSERHVYLKTPKTRNFVSKPRNAGSTKRIYLTFTPAGTTKVIPQYFANPPRELGLSGSSFAPRGTDSVTLYGLIAAYKRYHLAWL